MAEHPWLSALMVLSLIGASATLARLISTGLWRKYPAFSAWVLAAVVRLAVLCSIATRHPYGSREYMAAWEPLQKFGAVCLVLVGWEVYNNTVQNYPSIGNYGRRVIASASVIALAVSLLPFGLDHIQRYWHSDVWITSIVMRTAALAVAIMLLLQLVRWRLEPIAERKNLSWGRYLLLVYCLGQAVGMGMLSYTHAIAWNIFQLTVTAACWCLWPFAVTSAGEQIKLGSTEAEKAEEEYHAGGLVGFLRYATKRPSHVPWLR